jgi:hypothetical protein
MEHKSMMAAKKKQPEASATEKKKAKHHGRTHNKTVRTTEMVSQTPVRAILTKMLMRAIALDEVNSLPLSAGREQTSDASGAFGVV